MNICKKCSTKTKNKYFCSRSCANSYTNSIKPKRKRKIYYCESCDVEVPNRRKICDDCKVPDKTLGEVIYKHLHKTSAFGLVRSRARMITKNREQKCEHCGYDKHVEVCHIKPIHSYSLDTLVSRINAPENLKLLCPNCHWEFDNLSS